MSNTTDLYGSEYDSEDDDGFFLTPVLHYDISNKIKEANKMLFEENSIETIGNKDESANRRVTFSKELVSYAPHVLPETNTTDDEEDISIKEELEKVETTTSTTIEKLSDISEIIEEIDNHMILEQVSSTTTTKLDDKKKSLLELDPPLTTNYKHTRELKLPTQNEDKTLETEEAQEATTTHETPTDTQIDEVEDSATTDSTLSMQVGVIARKQIRLESKDQNVVTKNYKRHSSEKSKPCKASTPKFNYKTCCEYQQSRLPQYKGYISEYGLSLRERERLLQLHKRQARNLLEHETRLQNESMHRLSANEKAFSAWLLNKCRNAPNRTRNMFDCTKATKKRIMPARKQ